MKRGDLARNATGRGERQRRRSGSISPFGWLRTRIVGPEAGTRVEARSLDTAVEDAQDEARDGGGRGPDHPRRPERAPQVQIAPPTRKATGTRRTAALEGRRVGEGAEERGRRDVAEDVDREVARRHGRGPLPREDVVDDGRVDRAGRGEDEELRDDERREVDARIRDGQRDEREGDGDRASRRRRPRGRPPSSASGGRRPRSRPRRSRRTP